MGIAPDNRRLGVLATEARNLKARCNGSYVKKGGKSIRVICPDCNGTGGTWLVLTTLTCSKCNGRKKIKQREMITKECVPEGKQQCKGCKKANALIQLRDKFLVWYEGVIQRIRVNASKNQYSLNERMQNYWQNLDFNFTNNDGDGNDKYQYDEDNGDEYYDDDYVDDTRRRRRVGETSDILDTD